MSAKFIYHLNKIVKNNSIFFITFLTVIQISTLSAQKNISQKGLNLNEPYNIRYMQINTDHLQSLDPESTTAITEANFIRPDVNFLLDTAYVTSASGNPQRYTYTYDENGNITSELLEIQNGNAWKYFNLKTSTYDANGNLLMSFWRVWNNGAFVNSTKDTYTYSLEGYVLTYTYFYWENGAWVNNTHSSYSYNTAGNVVSNVIENWENSNWVNYSKELYVYDDNSNMLYAFGELWADTIWKNDQQYTYTYDDNGNLLTGVSQVWGVIDWENLARETYTYNSSNNRTMYLGELWGDTTWVNNNKYSYSYDALDKLQTAIGEMWAEGTWNYTTKKTYAYSTYGGVESLLSEAWDNFQWNSFSLCQYVYDEYGNALNAQYLTWDGSGWFQSDDGLINLYYNYSTQVESYLGFLVQGCYHSLPVGVVENNAILKDVIIAPNPTTNVSSVSFSLSNYANVNLSLFSDEGRLVSNIFMGMLDAGNHKFTVDVTGLSPGMYFVSLISNNKNKIVKLIVTK